MSVTVPEVATAASDGLGRTVHPGRVRVRVPVLLTVPGATRSAWLEVNGVPGRAVQLRQGSPVHVMATAVVPARSQVTVRLVVDGAVVSGWQHTAGR